MEKCNLTFFIIFVIIVQTFLSIISYKKKNIQIIMAPSFFVGGLLLFFAVTSKDCLQYYPYDWICCVFMMSSVVSLTLVFCNIIFDNMGTNVEIKVNKINQKYGFNNEKTGIISINENLHLLAVDEEELKDFLLKLLQKDEKVISVLNKVLEEYEEMR